MRKVFLIIGLLAYSIFSEAEPTAGQKTVQKNLVTWSATSGNWMLKTRLLFLGDAVYVDTSATGQANQFKRVDNASDSCSNPFNLGADSNSTVRPVWLYQLWETVRGVDKDSTTHTFRVQTRERVWDGSTRTIRWTPWTRKGANTGFTDVTILDSLLMGNVQSTAKTSAYALGNYLGAQARLCPDDNIATANAAGDSVFADSLFHFTR
jgi:hypothetical protein